jgi:outer membrane immunogenic protein
MIAAVVECREKGRAMRRMRFVICGLAIFGMVPQARAADLSDMFLRGSNSYQVGPSSSRWEGVYFGAHAGYTTGSTNFGNAVSSLVSFALRNSVIQDQVSTWTTLAKAETSGAGFGGFIGYNMRWDEVIYGVEASYSRVNLSMGASDTLSRAILNNDAAPAGHDHVYSMTVSGNASVRITDLMTFRGRAGWDGGAFMPYAFAGVAVGRADVSRSALVTGTLTDSFTTTSTVVDPLTGQTITITTPQSITSTLLLPGTMVDSQAGMLAYGWTLGLGVDVALMQNIFLRAEWEWVQFAPIKDMNVHTNTIRTGIAVKF